MNDKAAIRPQQQLFGPALGNRRVSHGRLEGRRIIVVGAGQRALDDPDPPVGNGRAIALLLARHGATLTCVDISKESVLETCAAIRAEGGTAYPELADVGQADLIPQVAERSVKHMGGLDGLVLVVGVSSGLPLDRQDAKAWDDEQAVNVRSNMLFSQQAMRRMDEGGSILLISSISALQGSSLNPAYETTKAAQLALARAIAMAGQPRGIRCNSLLPGLIDTPIGRAATRRRPNRLDRPLPFGRQGTGWEVAHAALFLISDESSYVNAHALVVDGGLTSGVAMAPAKTAG